MTRADRVRTSTETTSDRLLDVETAALARLSAGVQRTADAARERIGVAERGAGRLALLSAELTPSSSWVSGVLLPVVADLLAASREQALELLARQLAVIGSSVPGGRQLTEAGVQAARDAAPRVEREEYAAFGDAAARAWAAVDDRVSEQRRYWWARHEEPPALIARVCSRERVALPGATRGAVWALEAPIQAAARASSVSLANRLLTVGMEGWNEARGG